MDLRKDDNPKKIGSELELDIEIEKNYTKKIFIIFIIHVRSTNSISSHQKTKTVLSGMMTWKD